jgi:hypothetical protein
LGAELRGRYTRFAEESAEHTRIVNRDLFGLENGLKAQRGEYEALLQPSLIADKHKADLELKARVDADPKLKAATGDPWADITRAQAERAALAKPYYFVETRAGGGSTLYGYARTLVRGAAERAKPNGERFREYADARLPLVERGLLARRPVENDVEQVKLEFWLTKLRKS